MQRRVLLKDIAQKMGLTINTVSRALKDKDDISIKTKEQVQKVALSMGYIPDVVASSLRSGVTKTIGVMFDNIANPYFVIMTDLLHKVLKKDGYEMMIYTNSGDHAQLDIENFNMMASRRLDGIITFLKPTQDVVELSKKNQLPIVILGREGDDIGIDAVFTNDYMGGYLMGEYLYHRHHDKVAYIGAPVDILCSIKRAEGLFDYYKEKGVEIDKDERIFIEHYSVDLKKHLDYLVSKGIKAIFCFNDSMAYDAITYLSKEHPNAQVEITGYDNIGERLRIPVKLPTIDSNKESMVETVLEFLKNRIQHANYPVQMKIYETRLVKFDE